MKKFFLFTLIFFWSCADSGKPEDSISFLDFGFLGSQKTSEQNVWICHHPNSEYHGKICVDDIFPNGCYVPGDNTKFCWILNKEDCSGKLLEEWQIINCPLLKGN